MKHTRYTLAANAGTCFSFGFLFVFFAPDVAQFLGNDLVFETRIVGALLIAHGAHLSLVAWFSSLPRRLVYYFSAGDVLWFLATLVLLVATDLVSTTQGVIASLGVAIIVVSLGMAQLWTHSQATRSAVPNSSDPASDQYMPAHFSRLGAIGKSWLQMKTWVKVWLFGLNGVFLAALFYWPTPLAQVILVAFIASGPLLFTIMIVQRGLTRLLGIAHLLPWLPLLGYLIVRLSSDQFGPQIVPGTPGYLYEYTLALISVTTICLAFDVYDLVRWIKGDRARIGAPSDLASSQRGYAQ